MFSFPNHSKAVSFLASKINRKSSGMSGKIVTRFPSDCFHSCTGAPWTCLGGFLSFLAQIFFTMSNFLQLLRAAPAPFRRLSCGRGAKGSLGFSVSGNFLRLRSSAALSSSPRHRNRPRTRGYASYSRREPVRIGCASGFWGDTATSGRPSRHHPSR